MSKRLVFLLSLSLMFVVLSVFVGAAQAQSTGLPPLTEPGPYGVGIKILHLVDPSRENWTLDTYVWYPADKTDATPVMRGHLVLRDALPNRSDAPYPLIIFSHGWMGCQHRWEVSSDQGNELSNDHRSKCPLNNGLGQVTGITSSITSGASLAASGGFGRPSNPARRFSLRR